MGSGVFHHGMTDQLPAALGLPGLEPGLLDSESKVIANYTIGPVLLSTTGNRTPGICVTGRDVTNYTIADMNIYIYTLISYWCKSVCDMRIRRVRISK